MRRLDICRESYGQRLLGLSRRLIHRFSETTRNHQGSLLCRDS